MAEGGISMRSSFCGQPTCAKLVLNRGTGLLFDARDVFVGNAENAEDLRLLLM